MKFLVLFAILAYAAAVDVSSPDYTAPIVKSNYDVNPDGTFQYNYETGNGIYGEASGVVKNPNSEYPSLTINGAYKYTAPDGQPIQVTYSADEEGFKPVGSHLPVPPPVPEYVLRSLAYIAAHPPPPSSFEKAVKPTFG